ncbi:hypothetical protein ColLi_05151 [Colletotrichum liriopes]|uniref:Uncharacterized protein n=1 Tax=Colletotrichum liriopes TaxID=708192 RepID=A0AA37GLB6_9PEZI|nr:hypothetical protein ColLi_05151 [Colletotrichum liriopes]
MLLPSADSSPLRSILLLGPAGPRSPRPRSPVGLSGALNGAARGAKLMSPSSSPSSSSSELAPRASLLLLRLSSASESLPGLGDLVVEVGVHVHAQVVAGTAALAGGEEVLLVEHVALARGLELLFRAIPHLARLLAFGNVLESVLPAASASASSCASCSRLIASACSSCSRLSSRIWCRLLGTPGGFSHVLPKFWTCSRRRSICCSSARRRASADRSMSSWPARREDELCCCCCWEGPPWLLSRWSWASRRAAWVTGLREEVYQIECDCS